MPSVFDLLPFIGRYNHSYILLTYFQRELESLRGAQYWLAPINSGTIELLEKERLILFDAKIIELIDACIVVNEMIRFYRNNPNKTSIHDSYEQDIKEQKYRIFVQVQKMRRYCMRKFLYYGFLTISVAIALSFIVYHLAANLPWLSKVH